MKTGNSIRRKLFLSHFLAVLLVSGSIGSYFYFNAAQSLMQSLQSRLRNSAALVAEALDADTFRLIRTPEDRSLPAYEANLRRLRAFRTTNPDIAFLYVMRLEGGRVFFVVDSDESADQALPGREYRDVVPTLIAGFRVASVDPQIYTDQWGAFMSGYAPLPGTAGELMVGLDMRANEVQRKYRRLRTSGLVSLAGSLLLAVVFSRMLSRHFTTPINLLISRCRAIAAGQLDGQISSHTADELDDLVEAFNSMSARLAQSREDNRLAATDLREARDDLESRVQQRTRDLVALNEQLKHEIEERRKAEDSRNQIEQQMQNVQRLESLGVMAGGIAHDYNNLLAAILGNAEIAESLLPQDAPARPCLDEIRKAGGRAAELTYQMLTYSGKSRLSLGPVLLNDLLQGMQELLKASVSKKCALQFEFATGLPPMQGDADRLEQIIVNLVTNASEAIGDRPGTVAIRTGLMKSDPAFFADAYLRQTSPAEQYVCLSVEDDGPGMDDEMLSRIFEPFFSTKFPGRGLGLAAVLGIVRAHGGNIKVKSQAGKGTHIAVCFPAPTPAAAIPAPPPPANSARGDKVLVVDDEEGVRDVARRMLERQGFSVITAANGREALEVFQTRGPEIGVVLLDMTMPVMGGVEAMRGIRGLGFNVPVILASGYQAKDTIHEFGDLGLAGFVRKPFSMKEIGALVKSLLARPA
jgi:signal transduction histidine kinase/CheY-like chemotaxis protein